MPRVLVADDEEELLELIRFSFDASGYDVVTVPNGKKAYDKSQEEEFDLVVLDVMMPEMDGYHAARLIADDPHAPPVLLLTSRDYSQDQAAVQGSGADAFLNKPFEIPELLDVASDLIGRHQKKKSA